MHTKIIVDCETGISEEIELTKEEIALRLAEAEEYEEHQKQLQLEAAAKEAARAAVLKKLGLTAEEAATLLG